jgi:ATP-binding cassette subfamily C (CFTR/MRP) protein 1
VDVEKLVKFVQHIHEFWATLVSAIVALYILYSYLGIAFIAPFLTTLITTGICTWIGKYMGPGMGAWAAATERRVNAIAYATSNMKGVRMLGLSNSVLEMLTRLREQEVEAHRHVRKFVVWILTISNVIFQITSVATYVTFIVIMMVKSNVAALNYNTLYGSMSALKLVTSPLLTVLQLIPALQTGLTSLERIQQFLLGGSLDKEEETHAVAQPENTEDIELLPLGSQIPSVDHDLAAPVFAMKDATFEVDETPLLTNINLKISKREFHFLIDTSTISYKTHGCIG